MLVEVCTYRKLCFNQVSMWRPVAHRAMHRSFELPERSRRRGNLAISTCVRLATAAAAAAARQLVVGEK